MARPSGRLRDGIDRDIYQIVRQLEGTRHLTISAVYDSIKHSNSSLARHKRRPLEESIERVLSHRKGEIIADAEDEDSDAAIEEAEKAQISIAADSRAVRDASLLNRQMTKHWDVSRQGSGVVRSKRKSPTPSSHLEKMDSNAPEGERQPSGEPKPKRRKSQRKDDVVQNRRPPTGISLDQMAGLDQAIGKLSELVLEPLCMGEFEAGFGTKAASAILIHGPSGCGKTSLVNALAACMGPEVPFIPVSASTLIGGLSGESEKNVRGIFDEAIQCAPCLVFFDDIEAIAIKRDNTSKAMEGRVVTEIMQGMDRVRSETVPGRFIVVMAASNAPDSIDPNVRRRFGSEVNLGMPNEAARAEILRAMTADIPLAPDVNVGVLAKLTPGFVGADLEHVRAAAIRIAKREHNQAYLANLEIQSVSGQTSMSPSQRFNLLRAGKNVLTEKPVITFQNFVDAISITQPAARREGFSTVPNTTWSHVGAMASVRHQLERYIIGPITHAAKYRGFGVQGSAGILLWGPPGCGKTLVAKAVANESKANFIAIKGPELLSKWLGDSERSVRSLFTRAKASAPCIIFFDEMDALVPKRDESHSDANIRVVNTLLTELDGVDDRSGIYVVGATNRPDMVDPAIRRQGRLGTSIYVGLPTPEERVDILVTLYRKRVKLDEDWNDVRPCIEYAAMDPRCQGFSGADLSSLLEAVGLNAIGRIKVSPEGTKYAMLMQDWEKALGQVKKSVADKDLARYTNVV